MANATVLGHGTVNGAGADDALFLKVFSGEVLTAFAEKNVMRDLHVIREISSGKSAQFPATWKATAAYHTVGAEIVGQAVNHNERVITIDDMLVSDVFIPRIDEAKAHYDVRSEYSGQVGKALALTMDENVLRVACLAAQASATITGGNGGSQLTNANFATTGADLASGLFDAAQALDEKDVDEDNRYMAVRPAQYYLMAETTNVINRDWGGAGVYAEGTVLKVAGISVVKSNNVPSANLATGPAAYQGTFVNTQAVVFHRSAVGTVQLLQPKVEMSYDPRRLGYLVTAQAAVGHGILRPESAVEFITA